MHFALSRGSQKSSKKRLDLSLFVTWKLERLYLCCFLRLHLFSILLFVVIFTYLCNVIEDHFPNGIIDYIYKKLGIEIVGSGGEKVPTMGVHNKCKCAHEGEGLKFAVS